MKQATRSLILVACLSLAGCSSSWTIDLSQANQATSPLVTPAQLYTTWTPISVGVDFKQVLVQQGTHEELLDIVRIDPTQADISVHVDEANPASVSTWQEQLGATVVMNASYFDEDYQLVTRTQTTQATAGPLLSGTTGFFYQTETGWKIGDNVPTALQLVQSYPMLVADGEAQVETSANDPAQRTVVATNASGLVYFVVAEYGVLTMQQLSSALAELDQPQLEMALNFDGGSSTGLVISGSSLQYSDDSFLVPAVVAIQ